MEDGQTFVLGGLIQHTVDGQTRKLPVLGDIPFLGVFFSSKSYNESEDEVIVVVTPHLVDPMDCSQAPKLLPGQETRSPDDFELFLEGILEAPRGPREVCPNGHYVPAWKHSPTAGVYPCGNPAGGATDCGSAASVSGPAAAAAAAPTPAASTAAATDRLPAPESPLSAGSGKVAAERSGSDK
jgi:pilus assembly protein CpaC